LSPPFSTVFVSCLIYLFPPLYDSAHSSRPPLYHSTHLSSPFPTAFVLCLVYLHAPSLPLFYRYAHSRASPLFTIRLASRISSPVACLSCIKEVSCSASNHHPSYSRNPPFDVRSLSRLSSTSLSLFSPTSSDCTRAASNPRRLISTPSISFTDFFRSFNLDLLTRDALSRRSVLQYSHNRSRSLRLGGSALRSCIPLPLGPTLQLALTVHDRQQVDMLRPPRGIVWSRKEREGDDKEMI